MIKEISDKTDPAWQSVLSINHRDGSLTPSASVYILEQRTEPQIAKYVCVCVGKQIVSPD